MKQIPTGEFKASCHAIMDSLQATGEPVVITKRGVPVVKLSPAEGRATFSVSWRANSA